MMELNRKEKNLQNHKIIDLVKKHIYESLLKQTADVEWEKKSNENSHYSQKIGKSIST